jgi:hypothetical protein
VNFSFSSPVSSNKTKTASKKTKGEKRERHRLNKKKKRHSLNKNKRNTDFPTVLTKKNIEHKHVNFIVVAGDSSLAWV